MTNSAFDSIIGLDLGTELCTIGSLKQNFDETEKFNFFYLFSYLNFSDKEIEVGSLSKLNIFTNSKKSFYNLKHLIGKSYEQITKDENLYFAIEEGPNGELLIPTVIFEEEHLLTPTQLLAILFYKFKKVSKATSCVISCPSYFNDCQRREIINAALIANLNVLQIISDLASSALYYCYNRTNFEEKDNENVAFVDIGASSTQCSIINYDFKKKSFKVLVVEYDSNLGGNNLTDALANYFIDYHKLKLNKFSKLRLIASCEKLKTRMSNYGGFTSIDIECLNDEKDFTSKINRNKFEELCSDYFNRIELVLERALKKFMTSAQNKIENDLKIEAVSVTGGSSNIPAIRKKIKNVFGVNQFSPIDGHHNIALGCTLKSGLLNKALKNESVQYFKDYQPYQINGSYYHRFDPKLKKYSLVGFFEKGCTVPSTSQVKLNCQDLPIILDFYHLNEIGNSNHFGKFKIYSNEKLSFIKSKVIVKLRLDENGLLQIISTQLEIDSINEEEKNKKGKKKPSEKKLLNLKHKIIWLKGYLVKENLDKLKKFQSDLIDRSLTERLDSKNELKEFIDLWQDQIKKEDFFKYLDTESRKNFNIDLETIGKQFLTDEFDLKTKAFYKKRLQKLKEHADKITKGIDQTEYKKNIFCVTSNFIQEIELYSKEDNDYEKNYLENFGIQVKLYIEEYEKWINKYSIDSEKDKKPLEDTFYTFEMCEKKILELKICLNSFEKFLENKKEEKKKF